MVLLVWGICFLDQTGGLGIAGQGEGGRGYLINLLVSVSQHSELHFCNVLSPTILHKGNGGGLGMTDGPKDL